MSEWDGHLRVGTTDWNVPGRNGGGNHLKILKQKGNKLVQTGAVRGLAKGERIFSMRMVGDIGYMVTFQQTDPLYTIDLSNPKKPEVLGELKINGFSSYIHPLGLDHLLVTSYQPEAFSGAMVLKADPTDGFHDYGFLTQNNEQGRSWCEEMYGQHQYRRNVCAANSLMYYTQIQRTLIIDDYVVALSNMGVTMHSLVRPDRVLGAAQLMKPQHHGS